MEQKKNLRIWMILLGVLVAFLVVLLVLLWRVSAQQPPETEPIETTQPAADLQAELADWSVNLKTGGSAKLPVSNLAGLSFTSSDTSVATVDQDGNVKAAGKGAALITVSGNGQSVSCGVLVDMAGELIDVSKLTANVLFSNMMLNAQTEIKGMTIDPVKGVAYFSQGYGASAYKPLASDIIVTKMTLDAEGNWNRGSWMRFYGSGSGSLALDSEKLWLESNGTFMGFGTTASLVEWKDEGVGHDSFGQTVQQGGFGERISLTADPENNLIMVYDQNEKSYYLYDRTDLLENPSVEPLKKIKCEGHQTPAMGLDDSQGRYTASIRGYALADGYIYQLSGSTSIYISVFDLDGKLQYCYRLPDHPELEGRSPGAIAVENGKVYVTIQSGNSTCYYANLWVYEAAAE